MLRIFSTHARGGWEKPQATRTQLMFSIKSMLQRTAGIHQGGASWSCRRVGWAGMALLLAQLSSSNLGVQETVLLVNHALARGIFVIFVVSRGSSSKALVLLVRMQIRHFRHFRQKPPFSGADRSTVYQKHPFRAYRAILR